MVLLRIWYVPLQSQFSSELSEAIKGVSLHLRGQDRRSREEEQERVRQRIEDGSRESGKPGI